MFNIGVDHSHSFLLQTTMNPLGLRIGVPTHPSQYVASQRLVIKKPLVPNLSNDLHLDHVSLHEFLGQIVIRIAARCVQCGKPLNANHMNDTHMISVPVTLALDLVQGYVTKQEVNLIITVDIKESPTIILMTKGIILQPRLKVEV